MKARNSILRLLTGYTLLVSVAGIGVCPAAGQVLASMGRMGPVPAQHSNDRLPCRCDQLPAGCQCGASCCCNASAPQPNPVAPSQETQQQNFSRQILALHAYAAQHVAVEFGLLAIARTASASLISLNPTLQLEHVRIQT